MAIEIRLLGHGDESILARVAANVFDNDLDSQLTAEFLADPRHHLAVAIENGQVVGFASAVHYIHPDKPASLWINEIGIAPSHQRRGLGRAVLRKLLEVGRDLGCTEAWVLTERTNDAAMALYASTGGKEESDTVLFEFPLTPPE